MSAANETQVDPPHEDEVLGHGRRLNVNEAAVEDDDVAAHRLAANVNETQVEDPDEEPPV